jgi:surfactin synthase thioesterase subunit
LAEAVRGLGCRAESVDYQGIDDPTERVDKLIVECHGLKEPLVLVGSSMGGHVATAAAAPLSAIGLFVLAPAFCIGGLTKQTAPDIPISIVHGWRDDIVPPENSIEFASKCNATLHLVDGDHRLTENIDEIIRYLSSFIRDLASSDAAG